MLSTLCYFPPISYFASLLQAYRDNSLRWDIHGHYVKQTFRNRCEINSPGSMSEVLSIPVQKGASSQCPYGEVKISTHGNWVHQHRNAIVSNYGSAPFFEYYADDLLSVYDDLPVFLYEFNLQIFKKLIEVLDYERKPTALTSSYERVPSEDNRLEVFYRDRSEPRESRSYYQVFAVKKGFVADLSIIDLLFHLGPEARIYLIR